MNLVYKNDSDKLSEVRIIIEPSTDEFILKSEVNNTYYCDETIVIWLPRSTKGSVFIKNIHVESLAETRYW